jgi:hypothetical protein
MDQQCHDTIGRKDLSLQTAKKMPQRRSTAGVIVVATQCAEGTSMSWAPYLSNLFQVDYKDMQDAGTEFHYSWLITLIAFMGWREPEYVIFCTTPQPGGARYHVLRSAPLAKHKKENGIIFKAYLWEIQEAIS